MTSYFFRNAKKTNNNINKHNINNELSLLILKILLMHPLKNSKVFKIRIPIQIPSIDKLKYVKLFLINQETKFPSLITNLRSAIFANSLL